MEQVVNSILTASNLHSKLTGIPVDGAFTDKIKALGCGIFRLLVMGEIKKGKSSFINAFLGVKNLVPVASDIATSTVFQIHYGKEIGYRVFFEKATGKTPLRIDAAEIASYGTEDGNPGNEKQVSFIDVSYPSPLLKTGLVLIDTPGLGGLYKEHKKITWNYVPKADAVFFVTDSVESPIGIEEIAHLQTVLNITSHLYFVQTKASSVDKEARALRRKNNLSILSKALNMPEESIPYFIVDSLRKFSADETMNEKKLVRSGYPELMSYINDRLLKQKHSLLAARAARLAAPILTGISNNIAIRKDALAADTVEKQQQAKQDLAETEAELQQWQSTCLPDLRTKIMRSFSALKDDCERDCAQFRLNGPIHSQLENIINAAEDKKKLTETISDISDKLPEIATESFKQIRLKLENGIAEIVKNLCKESDSSHISLVKPSQGTSKLTLTENQYLKQVVENISKKDSAFTTISRGSMGRNVGSSIGAKIGSVLSFFIEDEDTAFFVEGISCIAGSICGIFLAKKELSHQEVAQSKNLTINALSKCVSSVYYDITRSIQDLFKGFNNTVEDALTQAIRFRTEELHKAHAELVERARMSATELTKAKNQLVQDEAQLRTIMKAIEPWMSQTAK